MYVILLFTYICLYVNRSYRGMSDWLIYVTYGTQTRYAGAFLSQQLFNNAGGMALENCTSAEDPARYAFCYCISCIITSLLVLVVIAKLISHLPSQHITSSNLRPFQNSETVRTTLSCLQSILLIASWKNGE